MLEGLLRAIVSGYLGAAGFGALLNAPKKGILWDAAIGSLGYTAYWLIFQLTGAELPAMFVAALLAAALGQVAARKLHMISTVFVTIAILPLVPGIGLYRAMSAMGQGDMTLGAKTAVQAMSLILMIVMGTGIGSALFSMRKPVDTKEEEL
ncbi:MAG: threonine/serine exporter family protein [Clostridia bacterium]|nr:threonine/serine exporter family protein [Clostridia bacterium]